MTIFRTVSGSAGPRKSSGASYPFIAREFLLPASALTGVMFPFLLTIQYKSGQLLDVLLGCVLWAVFVLVYWLPTGVLLLRWNGHWLGRFAAGYLFSLPLYFLTLLLAYPTVGGRFHPTTPAVWGIYLAETLPFYLMVFVLYLLVRRGRKLARITQSLAVLALAASVIATIVLLGRIDHYKAAALKTGRVEVVNAKIVDAPHGEIVEGQNILIENGRIAQLVRAESDHSDWPKIDAKGAYLVPGLIDVHTHLQAPVRSVLSDFDFQYFLDSILGDYAPQRRAYLENGITVVRDMGGPAAHIFALRAQIVEHKLRGPRIFAAGRLVTSPQGHPVSTIWTPSVSRQGAILATNPANLVSGLNANYQEGPPDLVKIIYGTIGIAKEKISPSLLRAAVDWAKEKNLPSVVHIETVQEARDAVDAGAAGIEHAAMIESLPDSLVNAIVADKTFVDPTFGEYETALTLQHVERAEIDRRLQQKYGFMRRLYSAGAKIAIGTDAPLVRFGEGFEDEMDHFAKAGFTPAQILTFATQANAEYLGKSNEFGKIAPGYDADFMAVGQNPLQGLGALRKLDFVMFDGEVIGAKR